METLEELEALDRKAIEQQYIASYHYSRPQKAVAIIAILLVVFGLLAGGTYLAVSIINHFIK